MAVGDAYVVPGFFTPVQTQRFFPKPLTTFLTCFCRGERRKDAGKKGASTWDRTYNHQVMSRTRSPLSHPGGATLSLCEIAWSLASTAEVVTRDTEQNKH